MDPFVYSHLVFDDKSVHLHHFEYPLPNWPFISVDSLLNLCTPISDEAQQYFLHLTTGQFLCLAETAKNFEAYNYEVRNEEIESCQSAWQHILKVWLQTFTKTKDEIEVKAIWGLYNRRSKRFKELRKSYNARGDVRVKETLTAFLNEPFDLPKKKTLVVEPPVSDSLKEEVHVEILTEITNVNVKKVDISHIHGENRRLRKSYLSQTSLIKCRNSAIKKFKEENENLKVELSNKRKQLKESLKTVDTLMNKQTVLLNRRKELRELKIKYKYKEKHIQELNSEICQLKSITTEALDFVDQTENEKIELANTLTSMPKKLKSKQKKVQRRNKNISNFKTKLCIAREKNETDKEAIEMYYEGIVDSLKNQHKLSTDSLQQQLKDMNEIETQKGGKYKGEVRLLYYDLLTKGVSANTVQFVVKSVLENMTNYDMNKIKLPGRTTAQRMVAEAGALVKIRAAYELAREKSVLCHQSDGTTKHLIHWGAHAIKLLPRDDSNNPKFFTLTVSPVGSGKADDTIKQLQEQLDELSEIADNINIEHDKESYSFMRISGRMSDRAANEKKVTRLIKEKKEELNIRGDSQYENEVHFFTCAAHKINNMALAMTDMSAKFLYTTDSNGRGMIGAKKHIYECNKLLCEHGRKEYGLGVDFKAYTLCSPEDSGSELFSPIVGNRYLIFLQNAIPTYVAKDMVLVYLEDVRDAKEVPGLNRLEYSVQEGYLNPTVEAEEAAYALMYYYVCAPLLRKAKSSKSPLEMNKYYTWTIDKLRKWSEDPTGLVSGTDLLWENATGSEIYLSYMTTIHDKSSSSELVAEIIKVMAKAGMDKLHAHAEEHLSGGVYDDPTPAMVNAANTIGEATNDRIESLFGMLDRQMMIAPSSNPLNLESLITAKQDKPVAWLKASNLSAETVCNIAMKQSCVKRKLLGTRNEQIKRRFMERKTEKDQLILKRRQLRAERKKKLEEKINKAKTMLIRDEKRIKTVNKSQLSEQAQLWRAISSVNVVQNIEMLKKFTKCNQDEKVALLQKLIKKNVSLRLTNSDNWNSSDDDDLEMGRPLSSILSKPIDNAESDWNTSDEESLDMSRPLKKAKF